MDLDELNALDEIKRLKARYCQCIDLHNWDDFAALFHEDSYWRDLVAFTWNLKTLEGPEEIAAMLDAQLEHVRPSGWHATEPPDTADGVTTAWIAFETGFGDLSYFNRTFKRFYGNTPSEVRGAVIDIS